MSDAREEYVVARLRLPLPVGRLDLLADGLAAVYGTGLTMEQGEGQWLVIRRPEHPDE